MTEHKDMTPEVHKIFSAVRALEHNLNAQIVAFQKETGIPVLIEATPPTSKYIGAPNVPEIKVSAFIYDPH